MILRVLATLLLLASFSASSLASQILNRPDDAEPASLDPQHITAGDDIAITTDLFTGLLTLDPHGQPVPGVADHWEIAPDGKTWTFHLRPGLTWSNGDPLTAADFVYSFRRLVDPKPAAADPSDLKQLVGYDAIISGRQTDLSTLGVSAPDPQTLVLNLTEPRLALRFMLTDAALFPLHRASIEHWGAAWTQPGHLVSNGPFTLKSWTPQSEIVLQKNQAFYDAAAVKLDEVRWVVTEDREAGFRRFRAGELDWVGLSHTTLSAARHDMPDQIHTAPVNLIRFVFFNMVKGTLAENKEIRRALNLATDRAIIDSKIDPRGEQPAYGLIPPTVSGFTGQNMDFAETPMPDRITEAQNLMRQAGYGPDKPLALTVSYTTNDTNRQILLAMRQMWQKIYVDLTLNNMEWQALESTITTRNFQLGLMIQESTYDDYEGGLDNYRSDAGAFNWCGYANSAFDDLFHRGATAIDMATRRHLMEQAEAAFLADYPMIPLDYGTRNAAVNPKLLGFVDGTINLQSRFLSFKDSAS